MSFDWMQVQAPVAASTSTKAAFVQEIEERAQMLHGLQYRRQDAQRRIVSNLRWEFETLADPGFFGEVEAIVARVYGYTPEADTADDEATA